MENTQFAMNLFKYMERNYPLKRLHREEFRERSAKRWAIMEYITFLLDHPKEDRSMLLDIMIGRVACMVSHLLTNSKDDRAEPFKSALSALIDLNEQINKL